MLGQEAEEPIRARGTQARKGGCSGNGSADSVPRSVAPARGEARADHVTARTADHALVRPPHGIRMVTRALPPPQRVREKAPAGSACSTAAAGLSPLLPCRTQALEDDEGDNGSQADGDAAPPIGWSLMAVEVLAVQPQTVRAPRAEELRHEAARVRADAAERGAGQRDEARRRLLGSPERAAVHRELALLRCCHRLGRR